MKTCPYCNSQSVVIDVDNRSHTAYDVICLECNQTFKLQRTPSTDIALELSEDLLKQ